MRFCIKADFKRVFSYKLYSFCTKLPDFFVNESLRVSIYKVFNSYGKVDIMGKILRVFPRLTRQTPDDDYVAIGSPNLFIPEDISEIHVSVTFTWDLPEAEVLVKEWSRYAPTAMGGPATGQRGGEFTPGMYLKNGYVITSRGCPNNCWFCSVPKREGNIRELEIKDGWIVQDDNLLACSEKHVRAVFEMLKRQKHRPIFSGGIEAKILKPWHIDLFKEVKPERIYFAYDTPDDLPPLLEAVKLFKEGGCYKSRLLFCYVLVGYHGDTFDKAEERLETVKNLGITPFAMLYRDFKGETKEEWRKFQRSWARPAAIWAKSRCKQLGKSD